MSTITHPIPIQTISLFQILIPLPSISHSLPTFTAPPQLFTHTRKGLRIFLGARITTPHHTYLTMSDAPPSRPLRIACLHGFRQNAQIFRRKTGALRKALERDISLIQGAATSKSRTRPRSPLAELHYLDAPFIIESIENDLATDHTADHQGRTNNRLVHSPAKLQEEEVIEEGKVMMDRTERSWLLMEGRKYSGWEKTVEFLKGKFEKEKYDGILAFSQGAILTSSLCALRKTPSLENAFRSIKFVICISGIPSRAEDHQHLFTHEIDLPSMHIWGLKDKIIPNRGSKLLRDLFQAEGREEMEHAGGHMVPNGAESRRMVCDFVGRFAGGVEDHRVIDAAL